MNERVRTAAMRALVGLLAVCAFVCASLASARPDAAQRGVVVRAVTAHSALSLRELRAGHPAELPAIVHAVKRTAERVGPSQTLDPAVALDLRGAVIAEATFVTLLRERRASSACRPADATAQHRSRAPPHAA